MVAGRWKGMRVGWWPLGVDLRDDCGLNHGVLRALYTLSMVHFKKSCQACTSHTSQSCTHTPHEPMLYLLSCRMPWGSLLCKMYHLCR